MPPIKYNICKRSRYSNRAVGFCKSRFYMEFLDENKANHDKCKQYIFEGSNLKN